MTDTPELLAAYKRLALAYSDALQNCKALNSSELREAESALRALLAPEREDVESLGRELARFRGILVSDYDFQPGCHGLDLIDRAIAALGMEGQRG